MCVADPVEADGPTARNEAFMKAALAYVEETFIIAEIVRLVPRWLAPYVWYLRSWTFANFRAVSLGRCWDGW